MIGIWGIVCENVEFVKQGEVMLVVCENETDMAAANNPVFIKEIEDVVHCKVRLTCKINVDTQTKEDPLDDIINKAKTTGQLNLF